MEGLEGAVSQRAHCRSCGSSDLATVLDFGPTPLADRLVPSDALDVPDPVWPLTLVFCRACALVQVTFDVPGEAYGDDYPYYTSTNPGLVEHFAEGAREIDQRRALSDGALVVEIASNDGVQLAPLRELGARVLGVDPASGPAGEANRKGLTTRCEFFTAESAARIAEEMGQAEVLVGNNALNLLPDLEDFRVAVRALLAPGGMLVLEVPSLLETLEQGAFDNVFHQNATYWSLLAMRAMLAPLGLEVFDLQRIPTFGGSLRLFCGAGRPVTSAVHEQAAAEERAGLGDEQAYSAFGARAREVRDRLRQQLLELRAAGRRCVAYGAAGGMATTLLSFLDLPPGTLEYAVDLNPHKHGSWTPGHRLLIRPVETLLEDRPDVALLLAWNFADAILEAQGQWRAAGGRFLIPIPEPRLV